MNRYQSGWSGKRTRARLSAFRAVNPVRAIWLVSEQVRKFVGVPLDYGKNAGWAVPLNGTSARRAAGEFARA
jgi:hypothetical protein